MKLDLRDIARVTAATGEAYGVVSGFSIDSRTLQPGDLFFALRGERFDGNDFVPEVLAKGASAAVVDMEHIITGPLLRVPDSLKAMQNLARWARGGWGGPVVAITGSAGKTTTKDVVAALLGSKMKVGKTEGNYNNEIGLPISVLRIPEDSGIAVFELGMNHPGEIRSMARIARPDVAVITNAGYAHIENFDSIEEVAAAKWELVEELPSEGIAVINYDDIRLQDLARSHVGRLVRFGLGPSTHIHAEDVELSDSGVRFRVGAVRFESSLMGRHGVRNILAGIAVAQVFNIAPEELVETVKALAPGKMRGERFTHRGTTIFDDCYNSNPDAARNMLDVLRETPASRHVAVLGEMLELGRWAEPLHRDIGRYAVECGISVLVGIRGAARVMVDAAMEAGLAVSAAYFFENASEAGAALREIAREGDAILFKGSRGTHVEKALERFTK